MDISNANVWNADSHLSMGDEIEIKCCLHCGHTQRLKYKVMCCPTCDYVPMFMFINHNHLVGYIDKYGLGNMNILDEDLKKTILDAFS